LTDFEFENEDDRPNYGVLEVDPTRAIYQHTVENVDLFQPGVELSLLERMRVSASEFADDFVWASAEEISD